MPLIDENNNHLDVELMSDVASVFSTKNGLIGSSYKFPKVTVTGTSNLIMASIFAKGLHYIKQKLVKKLNNQEL